MDASIFIQGLGLAGVVAAMIWDMRVAEAQIRTGRAHARSATPEQRCPFCHQEFDDENVRVRCASCGTSHHAGCWVEHSRCSIFGCGSEDLREAAEDTGAEAEPQAEVTQATSCG